MRRFWGPLISVWVLASGVARASAAPAATMPVPSGRIRTLTPQNLGPFAGAPESAARAAIAQLGSQIGPMGPSDSFALDRVWEFSDGQGSVVRLQQTHGGHIVLDAMVIVRLDASGRVRRVSSSVQAVSKAAAVPQISEAQAIELARSHVRQALPLSQQGGARLVVLPTNGGTLAWDVYVQTSFRTHAITVTLDAQTGEYFFQREHARSAGKANVFATGKIAKSARRADDTFNPALLTVVDLLGLVAPGPNQTLNSDVPGHANDTQDIVGYDCCPTMNCDGKTPPPTVQGKYPDGQYSIPFTAVICDEKPIALSDSNGDYLFTPPKEPSANTPIPSPADGDAFSVVMGYHHAAEQLAYLRELEPTFKLAPAANPLRVTTNFLDSDFNNASGNAGSGLVVNKLTRVDNSQFVPAGTLEHLYGSAYKRDFDSVILYQGTTSDFAYDAHVVSHEFTHGVVEATAALQDYTVDDWGVIDSPSAVNEGFADFWAAARLNDPQIGQYVGDLSGKSEGSLRDLENTYSCPSVISGEPHWDSQHFSAGLWAARKAAAQSDVNLRKFDAAVLRAMPMIQPLSSYDDAVLDVVNEVEKVFPESDLAIEAAFTSRGFGTFGTDQFGTISLSGCERVADVTPDKPYLPASPGLGLILPPEGRFTPYVPSAVQFRLQPPAGATQVTFTLKASDGQTFPRTWAMFKPDAHISFSAEGQKLKDDAPSTGEFAKDGTVSFSLTPACGDTKFYFSLGNKDLYEVQVSRLSVAYAVDAAKARACAPATAGTSPVKPKQGCQSGAPSVWAGL
jgi:hypothetical protein